jgi:tetratricopeptide (TPR) repeat protein
MAALLAAAVATPVRAQMSNPAPAFEQANALYEAGDYEKAAGLYQQLVSAGVENADLFYNLGNAWYKAGEIGRAIVNYERARRLAPRNDDIAANLDLARSLLRDRQFVDDSHWLRRVIMWPHDNLSTRETFVVGSVFYSLLMLAILGFIFRRSSFVGRLYPLLSMASPGRLLGLDRTQDFILAICATFLLTAFTGVSAWAKYEEETGRSRAVVVQEEVAVYSGPSDDSTLQFKIHEGTEVQIDGARTRWAQVRLPGGLSGWIRTGAVERI